MNEVFPHESNKSGTIRGPDRLETLSSEQLQSTRVNFNCNESMIKDVVLSQSNTSAVLASAHDALPNIDDHETSEHGRLMPTNMHSDLVDSKTSGHCDAVLPKISTIRGLCLSPLMIVMLHCQRATVMQLQPLALLILTCRKLQIFRESVVTQIQLVIWSSKEVHKPTNLPGVSRSSRQLPEKKKGIRARRTTKGHTLKIGG